MSTVGGGVPVTIDQPYCIRSYHRAQLFVCCCTPEFIDIFGSVLSYFFVHLFFSKALHYNPGYRNMKRIEAKGLSALVAEMCVVWAENYKPASLYEFELRLYCSNINPSSLYKHTRHRYAKSSLSADAVHHFWWLHATR